MYFLRTSKLAEELVVGEISSSNSWKSKKQRSNHYKTNNRLFWRRHLRDIRLINIVKFPKSRNKIKES